MPEVGIHNATYKRVVRFRGQQHFGYDVTCSCGFNCSKHYKSIPATKCARKHEQMYDLGDIAARVANRKSSDALWARFEGE